MITKTSGSEGKVCATYLNCPGRKHLHAKSNMICHLKNSKMNAFGKYSGAFRNILDTQVPAKVVESMLVLENDIIQKDLTKFQRVTVLKKQAHFPIVEILMTETKAHDAMVSN
mmetsp:Transcript_27703/g.38687  ORF Transcript_27703/g.38687 Transcript_27703/m.38687 type:complete len:113 (+) Transcript_27703:904-1242(+)